MTEETTAKPFAYPTSCASCDYSNTGCPVSCIFKVKTIKYDYVPLDDEWWK